eukprot:CAMPEP_0197515362 /NCGR_PEP_ID=MMETSP1318-20131121/525_1 /TAXON_ID=552666 /ORGANISM="Partenskyella glossopodia, Strain RCC365" /LENGTH=250 /DNA_ID=CAMNT_0043063721 /DNA_START=20 /DNA_END=772 /DNA_ORIENTATION=+
MAGSKVKKAASPAEGKDAKDAKPAHAATESIEVNIDELKRKKQTLLDLAVDVYKKRKNTRTSRMFYTCLKGKKNGIEKLHKKFVKIPSESSDRGQITGFASLLSGTVFVHIIEAPTKVLEGLLRELVKAEQKELIKDCRIISFTEEVTRFYKKWTINESSPDADEPREQETHVLGWSLLQKMLQLGIESGEEAPSEKLLLKYVPSTQKMLKVASSNDLCSPAEYVEIFNSPIDFTLGNEKMWPVEDLVKF